jgi:hypothetical protein
VVRNVAEIWRAYLEVDSHLQERWQSARSERVRERWRRLRNVNDQAYFVVLFACFDDRVTSLCQRLVTRKRALTTWKQRRIWDTVDIERLDFMEFMRKVALLLDKRHAAYGEVKTLYKTRCDIAHGAFKPVGAIDLPFEYKRIVRLWKALSPS